MLNIAQCVTTAEPLTAVEIRRFRGRPAAGPIIRIPAAEQLQFLGASHLDGMVEVAWQGQSYAAFRIDVDSRCRPTHPN